jgi:glycosyltransferase involved in cell wall biosynthesis
MSSRPKVIVAIPVKNEEARIGPCLDMLLTQSAQVDEILLLLNNCTDGTLRICQDYAGRTGKLRIIECTLAGKLASAGEARRLVFQYAALSAGDGIILTTDADTLPGQHWVEANLQEFERGADIVCGMARLDAADAASLPKALQADEKQEARLMAIQDEIAAILDPDPIDPWPRHQHHSGASLAVRAAILRKAGGAPHVATGEDRALVERLLLVDAKIRHAPQITVQVSGRLDGRADGGMAATLKRRLQQRDVWTDARLEPTVDAYRRILARVRLRNVLRGQENGDVLAEDLLISAGVMRHALRAPYLGACWAAIQRLSPVLQRRRLEFCNLKQEIRQALALREQLQAELTVPWGLHPAEENQSNLSSDENAQ